MSIPGLQYVDQYISPAEHDALLAAVDQELWLTDLKRRVQHYGYRYDYKKRSVDPTMHLGALPDWLLPLAERICADGLIETIPDQVIVNEYVPGQGIASHVDCEPCFGDTILSLTLGSACVMDFTHLKSKQVIPVLLQPCSLIVMRGEVRYDWQHGIAARKSDVFEGRLIERGRRVSLTLRKVIINQD